MKRKKIIKELTSILLHLKNSTIKYSAKKLELGKRINQTVDDLQTLSSKLIEIGCQKTAKFIS
ncbi:MAG: hypothetical protein LBB45_02870 [Methanobrevibacter sp.]|jgi:hypothetical protein|nr:hypothetical protein [Candidatus Methanovirga basalitermitum]